MSTPYVTVERLRAFVQLLQDTRTAQRLYRKTLDARLRVEVPKLEQHLDHEAAQLSADLLAMAEAEAAALEGGVS